MKWVEVGSGTRAFARGSLDIGYYKQEVRQSTCGRFQAQRCREYNGRNARGGIRYYTYWKLFDGDKCVGSGYWHDVRRCAESIVQKEQIAKEKPDA